MQYLITKVQSIGIFMVGVITAFLICSVALNILFYVGKISSPSGAYCDGYYAGSSNVINGTLKGLK